MYLVFLPWVWSGGYSATATTGLFGVINYVVFLVSDYILVFRYVIRVVLLVVSDYIVVIFSVILCGPLLKPDYTRLRGWWPWVWVFKFFV